MRISGGGRGMGAIRAHLDYISRHGRLVLEDQDGERHIGKEDWHGWAIAGSTAGCRSPNRLNGAKR
jgi:hypothetical protein